MSATSCAHASLGLVHFGDVGGDDADSVVLEGNGGRHFEELPVRRLKHLGERDLDETRLHGNDLEKKGVLFKPFQAEDVRVHALYITERTENTITREGSNSNTGWENEIVMGIGLCFVSNPSVEVISPVKEVLTRMKRQEGALRVSKKMKGRSSMDKAKNGKSRARTEWILMR